ncbi:hypothetical protein BDD12DRAFT_436397 [Trichophaea hybrida]|nr:hypothetical protein BDD12DRAFT_436397 [Trichophaea hybrida]
MFIITPCGYALGGSVVICWCFVLIFRCKLVLCVRSSIYPLVRFSSLIFINYLVRLFFFYYISFVSSFFLLY